MMIVPAHHTQIDATIMLQKAERFPTRERFKAKRAAHKAATQIRRHGFRIDKSGTRVLLRRAIRSFKFCWSPWLYDRLTLGKKRPK